MFDMATGGSAKTGVGNKARSQGKDTARVLRLVLCGLLVFGGFMTTSQPTSAFTVERDTNHLMISGKIGPESASVFNRNLVEALLDLAFTGDRDSPVHLHLDLPHGGLADVSFHIVDIMKRAQTQGTRFAAHVGPEASCMSGCTFLFLAADERWIAPEGRLIFHGFANPDGTSVKKIPVKYARDYYGLLKFANTRFYEFFKQSRIIEDDKKVGFTGTTLFNQTAFAGLITGLK
ncbi:hypothetical protein E1180_11545 [Roseibium denhamense]|uniref:Clp protease n=1 Tax=Roseibium denhamense TaxID=76305 RepID=A0ABY1PDQ6_9HYPH|nr:hypothetical protein [Roseibium denhamense]MTI06147.1 hypothetical protein [Roseibium denhamense]SMP32219.1 hypothetical protein SAMN06265374_3502 [Roseibium denhamense]